MFVPDEWAAATVTGVLPGKDFAANDLVQWLAAERGIFVGGGIGEMAGKIFRVGHLGRAVSREYLEELLTGIEDFLASKSIEFTRGAGISALW